jgi:hypothetical protein
MNLKKTDWLVMFFGALVLMYVLPYIVEGFGWLCRL